MASVPLGLFLFHFVLLLGVRAQQNLSHIISLGSSLSPSTQPTSWPSPSGHFAFGFYRQGSGFAVGIWLVNQRDENIVVWTANRNDTSVSSSTTLELTKAGKLLLRTKQGEEKIIADVSAASASMLDSGNFVLYDANSSVIWQSFDSPTDTLLGGQNLTAGNRLVSSKSSSDHSSGRFFIGMQTDGNLVAYPVNSSSGPGDSYWSSGTVNTVSVQLSLDYRGLLSMNDEVSIIKSLTNSSYPTKRETTIYRATLDADGIFRLYSHHFENNSIPNVSMEWFAVQDQCDVKGFCGFNSYCSSTGAKGDCFCFPGFVPINRNEKFLGCSQNFTEDVCKKDLKFLYNVTAMKNMWWVDNPYSVVPKTEADCSMSCQEDCNCGAVLYDGQKCNKYKLPLRYAKIDQRLSATAFFKVSLGSSVNRQPPFPTNQIIINKDNGSLITILAVSLGSIAFFCFVLAISSFLSYWLRVRSYKKLSENGNLGLTEEHTLRSFAYSELEKATDGFKEELGRGHFGAVYRGTLTGTNKAIAVKRLEKVVEEGERAFQAEMTAIGRTHHRNLVRLLGFCVDGSRKLLAYEYMSNGSLADVLFKAERHPIWKDRVKIALDVAKGILYLHEECEVCIVHCNIKPQNILLDDLWTAKISDFGLAKLLIPNQTETADAIRKANGYSAPEWQRNELISVKADVYSFGVVLLEIICCRRSIEINAYTEDEIILSSWVYNCFATGELNKLVEDENVDLKTLERMVKVGLWCIQDDAALRPSMKNVILMLEGTTSVPVPPSPALKIVT